MKEVGTEGQKRNKERTARGYTELCFLLTFQTHRLQPGLTLKNSTFCPHSVFMCSIWISEQTAIISLYSINRLVFIPETECVYCAIWTEFVVIIQVNITVRGVKSQKVELRQNICFSLIQTITSSVTFFWKVLACWWMSSFLKRVIAQKVRLACSRTSYKLFPWPVWINIYTMTRVKQKWI